MSIYKGNKLIAGKGSKGPEGPDWAHAVELDIKSLYMEGYNAPSNGIIVGYFSTKGAGATAYIKINNITVARSMLGPGGNPNWDGNVQCPVNKSDHIILATNSSISSDKVVGNMCFVPYKAQ